MIVVGLSGAQGGGKSTLLSMLKGFGWRVDDFKVSRAVQAALGWEKLDRVMDDWNTMTTFQEEVLKQKANHDSMLYAKRPFELAARGNAAITLTPDPDDEIMDATILVERTFADISAYTNLWVWKHVGLGNVRLEDAIAWLVPYTTRCATLQNSLYRGTILLPFMKDVVKWEDDPNRASRTDVDAVYEDVVRFMETKVRIDHPRHVIKNAAVIDRADEVQQFLRMI